MPADFGGAEPVADRELTITRVSAVPARILFKAYSDCSHIKRWFGPKGAPVTMCQMDFRVGGTFRFAMTINGVQHPPFGGTYREIVPNRRIVYDNGFEGDPDGGHGIVTVTFEESKGRTTLTVHTLFTTIAIRDEHVKMGYVGGTNSGLDNLEILAAELLAQDPS